jgi:dihydropyrimidinase
MVDTGQLVDIMRETARHGGMVAIHAEDDEVILHNYMRYKEMGKWDWWYLPEIRSNLSEDLSVRRCIGVAEHTGAAMYIVHTSAREGVNAIAEARLRRLPVYGETILLYCSFNSDNYREPDGMKYHTYPGTKSETDRKRLWDGIINGDLQIMATDSIPTDYARKIAGRTVLDVQGGNIGIEVRMGLTYGDGVVKQGMPLQRFVDVTSTNVAKILGLYPRKGVLAPGSDADIVIIDPLVRKKVTVGDLHLRDYTPWEGWDVNGWPTITVLRGKVVVENGKFFGRLTDGKRIPRKIDSSILKGPAV